MTVYQGLIYEDGTNLAGLREDIYYLAKVDAGFISENDLNRIVNKYYFRLQEIIRKVNEDFYLVAATADLQLQSSNQGGYTYPDGSGAGAAPPYEKMKAIFAAFTPADITNPTFEEYQKCNVINAESLFDPSYSFTTPTAVLFGTYFLLLPFVTDTSKYPVTNGVKMYYVAEQNKLVSGTDVPLIFPSFHDAIVHGSLIDVAQRKGDMQLKADASAEWKTRCKEMAAYASDRLPVLQGLVEGQDNAGGWIYPWNENRIAGM